MISPQPKKGKKAKKSNAIPKKIVEAVRQHRSSTGNPQSEVAKIVADADSISGTTEEKFTRAYQYGLKHSPSLNEYKQIAKAYNHLKGKYTPGGTGYENLNFKESKRILISNFQPILDTNGHIDKLKKLLKK